MSYFDTYDIPHSITPKGKYPYVSTPYKNSTIIYKSKYHAFSTYIEKWLSLHPEYELKIEIFLSHILDILQDLNFKINDIDEFCHDIIYFMYKIHKDKDNTCLEDYSSDS